MERSIISRVVGEQSKGERLQRLRAIQLIFDELEKSPNISVLVACEHIEDIYLNKEDGYGENSEYIESDKSYASKCFSLNSDEVKNSLVSFLDCSLRFGKNIRYGFYTNTGITNERTTDLLKKNKLELPEEKLMNLLIDKDYLTVLPYLKCVVLEYYKNQYAGKNETGYLDVIEQYTDEMWIQFLEHIDWKFDQEDENQLEATLLLKIQRCHLYNTITVTGKEQYIIDALDKELEKRQASKEPIHRMISADTVRTKFFEIGNIVASAKHINLSSKNESDKFFNDIIDKNVNAFFVKTSYYTRALEALKQDNIVILIGQPGIGKTITSEKIAYDYKTNGFKILRSEKLNIGNAKNFLSEQLPQEKTLIILNDFLGQSITEYKNIDSSELSDLFRFLRAYDHIKLLINTRGVIYQEALQNTKINSEVTSSLNDICEIQMADLTFVEKAYILHCHLKRAFEKGILLSEHYQAVIQDSIYGKIVIHENFIPRIMEYITCKPFVTKTNPQNYVGEVFKTLANPSQIWKEEYEGLEKLDRILLNTLFSLTNTNVPIEILKECFEKRIKDEKSDTTINYFNNSINRLTESLVKLEVFHGEQRVGVLNPSINDFLLNHLSENRDEMEAIINHSMYYEQIERLITCKVPKNLLIAQIKDGIFKRLTTFPKQVFSDMEFMFAPPPYLYKLKIMLIHLNESDLVACGIHKLNIQNFVHKIFATQYDSIEANSRLYFAYEFPIVFAELIKSVNGYDLNEILAVEKYLKVIMDSIARCDVFWDILVDIQKRYYASSKEAFYKFPIVQSCIIERITSEVFWDVQEDILSKITSEIEDNYDALEECEEDYEKTDFVLQGIVDDIHEQITEIMNAKLDKRGINSITAEDFDIDTILSDYIDIHDMIERKYNEMMYSQSDDYKQQIQEPIENIVKLFEDTYWLS